MGVQLTIRDVPEPVRDQLAARAALQGKSMQVYLREELEKLAQRKTAADWIEEVRARKALAPRKIPASRIVQARDADRK